MLPRVELGIHGLKAGAATGLEKSEKRGIQAAFKVTKAEVATHFRASGKRGWSPPSPWPLFSRLTLDAPRSAPDQRDQIVADPPPLATACHRQPNWQEPTGPDLDERPRHSVCHRTDTSIGQIRLFPSVVAVHPFTAPSWSEALNASGSRRAGRMAIGRSARSLLALPDFPEFAQAVRYGVFGTPPLQRESVTDRLLDSPQT